MIKRNTEKKSFYWKRVLESLQYLNSNYSKTLLWGLPPLSLPTLGLMGPENSEVEEAGREPMTCKTRANPW